mmetsp:Transcript_38197/g.56390  ORF Transcript_38197/g.56390 Transcript_38197/m.56390 type:complete len:114 (+) Transcript_38197:86-427(+)|eukprot:scaffold18516_cov91-Skeletonema_dohrnii-CCMP3373.AAC.4
MDNSRRQTRNAGGGKMKECDEKMSGRQPKKTLKQSEDSESEASDDITPAAPKRKRKRKKKTTATKISDDPKGCGALKRSEDSESEASDDDDFTPAAPKQTRQECEQKRCCWWS